VKNVFSVGRAGGCDKANSVQRFVEGAPPKTFTIQLAWETQNESGPDIAATLAPFPEVMPDLGCLFGLGLVHESKRQCLQ
jgi:hypothetical protein